MFKSSTVQLVPTQGEAMRILKNAPPRISYFSRHRIPTLSREAKARLRWIEYYEEHRKVSLTCRRFGISRETSYRRKRRYNPRDFTTLENRSTSPKKLRCRNWTTEEVEVVREKRELYPRWRKDKLAVLLKREGIVLPVSKIGRIISYLKTRGVIREPIRAIKVCQRRWKRLYGIRKPRNYQARAPGDLVEIHTLDVRPLPGVVLKQFTSRDLVSRWDCLELAYQATTSTAKRALGGILERMAFLVKPIHVDGGSEFMAECRDRDIRLFILPPSSPKLNGHVERANRTHTEEFYHFSTANPTVAELGAELRKWETVYNTVKPHQRLNYLTPKEFLDNWKEHHTRKEELSRG